MRRLWGKTVKWLTVGSSWKENAHYKCFCVSIYFLKIFWKPFTVCKVKTSHTIVKQSILKKALSYTWSQKTCVWVLTSVTISVTLDSHLGPQSINSSICRSENSKTITIRVMGRVKEGNGSENCRSQIAYSNERYDEEKAQKYFLRKSWMYNCNLKFHLGSSRKSPAKWWWRCEVRSIWLLFLHWTLCSFRSEQICPLLVVCQPNIINPEGCAELIWPRFSAWS